MRRQFLSMPYRRDGSRGAFHLGRHGGHAAQPYRQLALSAGAAAIIRRDELLRDPVRAADRTAQAAAARQPHPRHPVRWCAGPAATSTPAPHHAWVVWAVPCWCRRCWWGCAYLAADGVSALLALAFDVAVLYLTLGFRQFSHYFTDIRDAWTAATRTGARAACWRVAPPRRQRAAAHRGAAPVIEHSLLAAHRHVFGVFFWFVLLSALAFGPAGAVLYRMAEFASATGPSARTAGRADQRPRLMQLSRPAVVRWIDHVPARLTAFGFAVVGNFEEAGHRLAPRRRAVGTQTSDRRDPGRRRRCGGACSWAGRGARRHAGPFKTFRHRRRLRHGAEESTAGLPPRSWATCAGIVVWWWRSVVLWMLLLALLIPGQLARLSFSAPARRDSSARISGRCGSRGLISPRSTAAARRSPAPAVGAVVEAALARVGARRSGISAASCSGVDLAQAEFLEPGESISAPRLVEPVPLRGGGGVAARCSARARSRRPARSVRHQRLMSVLLPVPLGPAPAWRWPAQARRQAATAMAVEPAAFSATSSTSCPSRGRARRAPVRWPTRSALFSTSRAGCRQVSSAAISARVPAAIR